MHRERILGFPTAEMVGCAQQEKGQLVIRIGSYWLLMKFIRRGKTGLVVLLGILLGESLCAAAPDPQGGDQIILRAWGVPPDAGSVENIAAIRVLQRFREKHPHIVPVSTTGLALPGGSRTMDMIPLMQIAGDIPAHVMYVNFRQSDTYIANKFLYPLDKYVEGMLGLDIKDGPMLSLDDYLAQLQTSPKYADEIAERVPYQCWIVMRRRCPYGADCPYCREWGIDAPVDHQHIWAFPQGPVVMALAYRKDLFHEVGLPDRVPETLDEMLEWARKLTEPAEERYGLQISLGETLAWSTLSILYSMDGLLVDQNENGEWRCVFDSPEAVEAYYYVARLFHEGFITPKGRECTSVVYPGESSGGQVRSAMKFTYLDQQFFNQDDPTLYGFGPVPKGPNGKRGSEFNSRMTGIYAGLEDDKAMRDAAWEYIHFFDGPEARLIRTREFVKNGLAKFVRPDMLIAAGFPEHARQVPKEWGSVLKEALRNGIPEPYGKNCQMVYSFASQAIDQIRTDKAVGRFIRDEDVAAAKSRIHEILKTRVDISNKKMLNVLTPEERKERNVVASIVAVGIVVIFVFVFRKVLRTFAAAQPRDPNAPKGSWQFGRFKWAYIILIPAVGTVILWRYYPLAKGTSMAFQDYNVRGFSEWIGMDNFARVLYDMDFWYAMYISFKYTLLFTLFGFTAPIALAILLTEVPRGKVFFRTLYYLPAVLTGVIVIYLWKSFYGQFGMVNQVVNFFVGILNHIPGVSLAEIHRSWLEDPALALLCILLPVIWAGMGPGCLIYLAALKTIPEDLYEAADIDGAGMLNKVFNVALPNIKALIIINFIGVVVGTVKGGGEFALAMTGGGPYTPHGQTEFVGLHIYWQAFGYLRFGAATAMAWVLGSMLVGFTVFQLQRLSKMEFRSAAGVK